MDRSLKGSVIGNYRLVSFIGKGDKGEVYKGELCKSEQPGATRQVAIKLFVKQTENDVQTVAAWLKEAETSTQIIHKNLVQVFSHGECSHGWYIVMEHLAGKDCNRLVRRCKKMAAPDAIKIVLEAAQGLETLHHMELLHRNVKPQNLLVSQNGIVKVSDFGLAQIPFIAADGSVQSVGTCAFMPPEQLTGGVLSPASDVYSLGATFYCLLSGRRPYEGSESEIVEAIRQGKPVPPLQENVPESPAVLCELITKMMAHDSFARYQSMTEVIAVLKKMRIKKAENIPSLWENPALFAESIVQSQSKSAASQKLATQKLTQRLKLTVATLALFVVGILAATLQFLSQNPREAMLQLLSACLENEAGQVQEEFELGENVYLSLKWQTAQFKPAAPFTITLQGSLPKEEIRLAEVVPGRLRADRFWLKNLPQQTGTHLVQFGIFYRKETIGKQLNCRLIPPQPAVKFISVAVLDNSGKKQSRFAWGDEMYLRLEWQVFKKKSDHLSASFSGQGLESQRQEFATPAPGNMSFQFPLRLVRLEEGNYQLIATVKMGQEEIRHTVDIQVVPPEVAFKLVSLQTVDSAGNPCRDFFYGADIHARLVWNMLKGSQDDLVIALSGDNIVPVTKNLPSRTLGEVSLQIPVQVYELREGDYSVQVVATVGQKELSEKCTFRLRRPLPEFEIVSLTFLNAAKAPSEVFVVEEPVVLRIRWRVQKVYEKAEVRLKISSTDNLQVIEEKLPDVVKPSKQELQRTLSFITPQPGAYPVRVEIVLDNTVKEATASLQIQPERVVSLRLTPQQQEVKVGKQIQFVATAYSKKNKALAVELAWEATGGTITASGLYTAGSESGDYVVRVREAKSGIEAKASVVIPYVLARIELVPSASGSLKPKENCLLQAQGYEKNGRKIPFTARWRAGGGTVVPAPGNALHANFSGTEAGKAWVEVQDSESEVAARVELEIKSVASGWAGEEMPPGLKRGSKQGEYVCEKDNSVLVYVPPDASIGKGFYIDKYELTCGQFSQFVAATGYKTVAENEGFSMVQDGTRWKRSAISWRTIYDQHPREQANRMPVVCITLKDVNQYAQWAGKRLLAQGEWMRAAGDAKYPWGNDAPGNDRCNYAPTWSTRNQDGFAYLAPVGSFPKGASPHGCMDMAGNVCEWTAEGMAVGGSWCHNDAGCTTMVALQFHPLCVRTGCHAIGARLALNQN